MSIKLYDLDDLANIVAAFPAANQAHAAGVLADVSAANALAFAISYPEAADATYSWRKNEIEVAARKAPHKNTERALRDFDLLESHTVSRTGVPCMNPPLPIQVSHLFLSFCYHTRSVTVLRGGKLSLILAAVRLEARPRIAELLGGLSRTNVSAYLRAVPQRRNYVSATDASRILAGAEGVKRDCHLARQLLVFLEYNIRHSSPKFALPPSLERFLAEVREAIDARETHTSPN